MVNQTHNFSTTERMQIEWQCQQFLFRVASLLDGAQWQALAQCYTEDAQLFRPSDPNTAIYGRKAILESFYQRAPRSSCHLISNICFDIHAAGQITASSKVLLVTGSISEQLPVIADENILVGSFVDQLVQIDDQWLIQQRKGRIELKYCSRPGL